HPDLHGPEALRHRSRGLDDQAAGLTHDTTATALTGEPLASQGSSLPLGQPNRFRVVTWRSRGTAPTQSVCAYNARGLSIRVMAVGRRPLERQAARFNPLRQRELVERDR